MVDEIIYAIEKLVRIDGRCIVAIDGRCGSGKTTLAEILRKYFDCSIIHMDEFFLPLEKRSEERLNEAGGNVDYERFLEEVLKPAFHNKSFSYKPFDCSKLCFGESIEIDKRNVTVLEGSYSCHPTLFEYYNLHIFLDADKDTQQMRIKERDGEDRLKVFNSKWIPMEEKYFTNTQLKYKCEIYYKTSV